MGAAWVGGFVSGLKQGAGNLLSGMAQAEVGLGKFGYDMSALPVDLVGTYGRPEFVYHPGAWPHAGTVLVGEGVLSDVYEKAKSDGGKLEFYVTETTWSNERTGKPVVTTKFTLAINCRPDADDPKPLS